MFDAHENKIREIFAGDNKYSIPRNQRKYVWNTKQWDDLFGDILYTYEMNKVGEKNSHFLGSFVLKKESGYNVIIDGQQRITTLMLVLGAIGLRFNVIGDKDEWGKTRQYLQGDIGLSKQYLRIENNDVKDIAILLDQICEYREFNGDTPLFDMSLFHHNIPANELVYTCIMHFYEKLTEQCGKAEDLVAIRDIILDMKIINISSENEIDCYDIFEILNARGVELESSELLKNFIFKYAQPTVVIDKAKEKWEKLEKNIEESGGDLDGFLNNYVTYKYSHPGKNESIYHVIKSNANKAEVYKLLDELLDASECYISIYAPDKACNEKIKECLEFFKLMNHRQFRPIFLALFYLQKKEYITEKQTEDMFIFLRNFTFAYTLVMGLTSNAINDLVIDSAQEIYKKHNKTVLNDIKTKFKTYYPTREEFIASFGNLGFSNKNPRFNNSNNRKRMKYIHMEYEKSLQTTNELIVKANSCNLEHIMNDSENDVNTYKVGNILLIAEKINEKMANDSFEAKRERLNNSKLLSVQAFMSRYGSKKQWTESEIKSRTTALAELAYDKLWKLN